MPIELLEREIQFYFLVGELVLIACPCSRTAPWATLEELLDKLIFLAVSGDGMF
jgi:hypothetical protein